MNWLCSPDSPSRYGGLRGVSNVCMYTTYLLRWFSLLATKQYQHSQLTLCQQTFLSMNVFPPPLLLSIYLFHYLSSIHLSINPSICTTSIRRISSTTKMAHTHMNCKNSLISTAHKPPTIFPKGGNLVKTTAAACICRLSFYGYLCNKTCLVIPNNKR